MSQITFDRTAFITAWRPVPHSPPPSVVFFGYETLSSAQQALIDEYYPYIHTIYGRDDDGNFFIATVQVDMVPLATAANKAADAEYARLVDEYNQKQYDLAEAQWVEENPELAEQYGSRSAYEQAQLEEARWVEENPELADEYGARDAWLAADPPIVDVSAISAAKSRS